MLKRKSSVRSSTVPQETPLAVQPLLVDIRSAARLLGTTIWCVRTLCWEKKLPHTTLGHRILFRPSDLEAFVDSRVETA